MKFAQINRVAETHRHIRMQIHKALKFPLSQQVKPFFLNSETYYDYWVKTFGDKFFDMTTFIRLGSSIEYHLRDLYMIKQQHNALIELKEDPKYKKNIFQRVLPENESNCINLYLSIGINLQENDKFKTIQEIMIHRHLYAHNSGVLDDEYLEKIKLYTGRDILSSGKLANYPKEDYFWFEPLERLDFFITETDDFFKKLEISINS